jgi:UDP:flavonoid glycosyltransferase YjiC (YdhE family)
MRTDDALSVPRAPYDALFPRCAAAFIHAGIGTAAASLRAGVPTVAVPFAHDQFDNATRLRLLGVSLTRQRWTTVGRLASALRAALGRSAVARAAEVGRRVSSETDGARRAAEEIGRIVEGGAG